MTYQQSTVGQYFVVVSREKFVNFLQVYGGVHLSLVQLRPNRSGYLAVGKLGPVETLQWVCRLQKKNNTSIKRYCMEKRLCYLLDANITDTTDAKKELCFKNPSNKP